MSRTIHWLLVTVFFVLVIVGLSSEKVFAQPKKIGILLWSDEARYTESTQAMLEQLKKDGFSDLEIKAESAGANKAIAVRLAQNFAAQKMDLFVGVGTNAVAALSKEISDIPIVFNVVYDPVEEGFVANWNHSKNNLTGVSNLLPMNEIIQRLKTFIPLKNLAVLYTPGQKNSESQLLDLQDIQKQCSFVVIPVPLSSEDDAVSVISLLKGKADAIFLTGSGFVGNSVGPILNEAIKEKLVPVSHLSDYVKKGLLLAAGADMKELGQLTAQKVEAILNGELPTEIPIGTPQKIQIYLNLRTAKTLGVIFPDALKKEAIKIDE